MDLIQFLFIVIQYHIALILTFSEDRSVQICEIYGVTQVLVDILFKNNKLNFFQKPCNYSLDILGSGFPVKGGTIYTIGKKDETLSGS